MLFKIQRKREKEDRTDPILITIKQIAFKSQRLTSNPGFQNKHLHFK